ncbi:hypothetical protein LEN26_001940, partial [Aphanomyces euteiches]
MAGETDFTIEQARRNRLAESTKQGYISGVNQVLQWAKAVNREDIVMQCPTRAGKTTVNLSVFTYDDFLEFIEWSVQTKNISVGTLSGYRSAIKSLYKDQRIAIPPGYDDDLMDVFSGIRRRNAQRLQDAEDNYTGKRPMSFAVFEFLAAKSILLPDGGFAHLFLILSWNLMCRSKSTETIRFDHFSCEDDAIGVTFHTTKTKQQ